MAKKKSSTNPPKTLPKYVNLGHSALRLTRRSKDWGYQSADVDHELVYWRDAGCWSVKFKWVKNKLLSVDINGCPWLDNIELVEITREEYAEDNYRYLPEEY